MKTDEIVYEIKKRLVNDYFGEDEIIKAFENDVDLAWVEFVDNQSTGEYQYICDITNFKDLEGVHVINGEVEVDYPSYEELDEYDDEVDDFVETEKENFYFPHQWITINGDIYEFCKGTLRDSIDWEDLYSVESEEVNRYIELF